MPKVDGFIILWDTSASMAQRYRQIPRIAHAAAFLEHLNLTIPDIPLAAGMRIFGADGTVMGLTTKRIYGVAAYDREKFGTAIAEGERVGGNSPLGEALLRAGDDLAEVTGQRVLILVTDGDEMGVSALSAARRIQERFGDRLCIHSVQIGDSDEGKALLESIVAVGGCGYAINADLVFHPADMADYARVVFLKRDEDSDGDGVFDSVDRCPDTAVGAVVTGEGCIPDSDRDGIPDATDHCLQTPIGAAVDSLGCRPDNDGDGVADDEDQCPGTPQGAHVDTRGCWVLHDVQFDIGAAQIKPRFAQRLDAVVATLQANPGVRVEIQGHTDDTGTAAVNQALSEQRALAVVEYLVGRGVAPARLAARGLGQTRPVAVNDTPQGRAMNRRVEIRIRH